MKALELYLKATKCETRDELEKFKIELTEYYQDILKFFEKDLSSKDIRNSSLIIFFEKAITVYNQRRNELENRRNNNAIKAMAGIGIVLTITQIIIQICK